MKHEDRYDSLIAYYAEKNGRDPRQIKKQLKAESAMDPWARNKKSGARGLAQFTGPTWAEWGTANFDDAYNPELAIQACCRYMDWLEGQLAYLEQALAAYNFGIGNVQREKKWPKETRDYVEKCLDYEKENLAAMA